MCSLQHMLGNKLHAPSIPNIISSQSPCLNVIVAFAFYIHTFDGIMALEENASSNEE